MPSGVSSSTRFDSAAEEVPVVRDEQHGAFIVPDSAWISICLVAMSRWLVGSSRTRKFGGSNSICAMTSRAFSPPDRTRQFFSIIVAGKAEAAGKCPQRRLAGLREIDLSSVWNTVLLAFEHLHGVLGEIAHLHAGADD